MHGGCMASPRRIPTRARWAVPVVAAAVVAGAIGVPLMSADASPNLSPKTAGQLLADIASAQARPFSGTVVESAHLGLPALPGQDGSSTSPLALLTGSHTVRVWYGGPQRARLALIGNLTESDVVRNGTDLWLWSSQDRTAQHYVLPAESADSSASASAKAKAAAPQNGLNDVTPQQAAKQALAAIDPTTAVTVDGTARVARRSAYTLVLRPKDTRSLVGSVRIAIDSKTDVPLRVQIFAKGGASPAFETGFTTVTFAQQAASMFRFTPPPNTKVSTESAPDVAGQHAKAAAPGTASKSTQGPKGSHGPTVIGKGWTSVVEMDGVQLGAAAGRNGSPSTDALLKSLKPVSGSFGTGRLLTTNLLSVLLLDNGKAFVGAVSPAMLERAAATASK
jgi:outer membrane lipoprotein-sorting protein